MGQQQLLLLVVAVVIVAISTVAAFIILDHYYKKDEADGLLDRSLSIATHAAYWKSKNDPFAGGNQSYVRLADSGLEMLALDETNIRGTYAIVNAGQNTMEVVGVSDRFPGVGVRVCVEGYNIVRSIIRQDGSITLTAPDEGEDTGC